MTHTHNHRDTRTNIETHRHTGTHTHTRIHIFTSTNAGKSNILKQNVLVAHAQLTEFFIQHGPVNCIRLRRHISSKDFKGSVFVEFASVADAEKVRSWFRVPCYWNGAYCAGRWCCVQIKSTQLQKSKT